VAGANGRGLLRSRDKQNAKGEGEKKMSKAKKNPGKEAASVGNVAIENVVPTEGQSIDKVRDILFGAQLRQYDQRFANAEKSQQREMSNLRKEVKKTTDSLEAYMEKEFESAAGQLKTEESERREEDKDISKKMDALAKSFDKKVSQLSEKLQEARRDLHGQILKQSKELSNEIQEKYESVTTALENAIGELRNDKTDRIELANLLLEVSMRLKEDTNYTDVDA